ncbi:jg14223 [Pararge aegeria aegeria]|uniref:Jg14223 protein n=1 Tax=Pararge aegeria aegeria TaxID=348720 RepID=A0A8S4RSP8_9NEOP|nr:jg14223 [Pararge aegeria aegeria]
MNYVEAPLKSVFLQYGELHPDKPQIQIFPSNEVEKKENNTQLKIERMFKFRRSRIGHGSPPTVEGGREGGKRFRPSTTLAQCGSVEHTYL